MPTESADLARAKTDRPHVAKGLVPRQLLLRIASALIMAPIALAAVYGGDLWLAALACVVGTIGMYEWNNIAGVKSRTLTTTNALVFLVSLIAYQLQQGAISLVVVVVGALLCGVISQAQHRRFIWAVWGQLYIGLAILSIVWMQDIYGWEAVIWLLFIIWAMDIGAYFAGSLIGGPKLAPKASPNKTWAGLIGGATTACLVSWLVGGYLNVAGEQVLIAAGIGLAMWSQLGDIIESLVKRHFGVKDSGAIIPGHGGVLDRIDSLLFTLPVLAGVQWLWPNFLALNG